MAEDQVQDTQDPAGGGTQPDSGVRTFTQEELNAILSDRLARERQKYADYDELRKAKEQLDDIRAEQMSELEKAQKRAEEAEAAKNRALQEANNRLIRAAFVAAAAKAGAAHPEDVYALADRASVAITEDGTVTGVNEAVQALADGGRLVMSGRAVAPDLDGGTGGGSRASDKPKPLSEEEAEMARKLRLTHEEYIKGKARPARQ